MEQGLALCRASGSQTNLRMIATGLGSAYALQGRLAEGHALLEEAERTMLADHPLLPLYFYVNKHLVKPEVLGWYDNVMNVVYSRDLALASRR